MNFPRPFDLVEFAPRDLTLQSPWSDAGYEVSPVGAPLDRLFGEPGEVFVAGVVGEVEVSLPASDPLVVLQTLADGLILPPSESGETLAAPDTHTSHAVATTPDLSQWDQAQADWTYDAFG